MARDALDPGPDGTYPAWPRDPVMGQPELGPGTRMPSGETWQRTPDGRLVRIDVTPTNDPSGTPIVPPTIPPAGGEGG